MNMYVLPQAHRVLRGNTLGLTLVAGRGPVCHEHALLECPNWNHGRVPESPATENKSAAHRLVFRTRLNSPGARTASGSFTALAAGMRAMFNKCLLN